MISNRSVPTDILLPHVVYPNVAEASAWLTKTFGFSEHYRYGDPSDPSGAQMHLGKCGLCCITLDRAPQVPPNQAPRRGVSPCLSRTSMPSRETKGAGAHCRTIPRNRLWRTAAWRSGFGRASRAVFPSCERLEPYRLERHGFSVREYYSAGFPVTDAVGAARSARR